MLKAFKCQEGTYKSHGDLEVTGDDVMQNVDVFAKSCPTRVVLDRIADKWALLALRRIGTTPLRFNQLRRDIEGVSQKVLSQTLKKLERDGLVSRKVFATVPVTVEYSITPLGLTLTEVATAISKWAESNIEKVLAAQKKYDRKVT
jgi:DNA-binding HxlR family transcriptional regulator